MSHAFHPLLGRGVLLCLLVLGLVSCASPSGIPKYSVKDGVVVSVVDQKMAVVSNGKPVKTYNVSTSKFGHGSKEGSHYTPLGWMEVSSKIGGGQPAGMVFKDRRPTGEILEPNTPGRDPIVSRIIWLCGNEGKNCNTKNRCIYIHGTPEERKIGSPASYGCIRMKSRDVIELYEMIGRGTPVVIENCSLQRSLELIDYVYNTPRDPMGIASTKRKKTTRG